MYTEDTMCVFGNREQSNSMQAPADSDVDLFPKDRVAVSFFLHLSGCDIAGRLSCGAAPHTSRVDRM